MADRVVQVPRGLAEPTAKPVRAGVISGRLQPGQRLSAMRLAADLPVSRTTLRNLFRLPERELLLVHAPDRRLSGSPEQPCSPVRALCPRRNDSLCGAGTG